MINVLTLFPINIEPTISEGLISKVNTAFKDAHGLLSLRMSEGDIMSPGGPPAFSKVIQASFESLEDFMAWVQTPAAQNDKEVWDENGIIRIFFEVKEL